MTHQQTKGKVQDRVENERRKDPARVQSHQQHQEEVVPARRRERRAESNQEILD